MLLIIAIICAALAAGSGLLGFLLLTGAIALLLRRLLGIFFLAFVVFLVLHIVL
jgi:hypothetical protein